MKIATIVFAAVFFLSLAGAAFLEGNQWMLCLWTAPAAFILMISGCAFLGIEFFVGPEVRGIVPVIGLVLGLAAALYLKMSGAVDVLLLSSERPPLENFGQKLAFSGSAGAAAAAVCFGMIGLRVPSLGIQAAGTFAIASGFYAAAYIPVAFQFAFPQPWQCALIVLVGAIFSVFHKRASSAEHQKKTMQ